MYKEYEYFKLGSNVCNYDYFYDNLENFIYIGVFYYILKFMYLLLKIDYFFIISVYFRFSD